MTRMLIVLCAVPTVICLSLARAEETTVITLSCDGTTKVYVKRDEGKRVRITQLGVVVNLVERTVLFNALCFLLAKTLLRRSGR